MTLSWLAFTVEERRALHLLNRRINPTVERLSAISGATIEQITGLALQALICVRNGSTMVTLPLLTHATRADSKVAMLASGRRRLAEIPEYRLAASLHYVARVAAGRLPKLGDVLHWTYGDADVLIDQVVAGRVEVIDAETGELVARPEVVASRIKHRDTLIGFRLSTHVRAELEEI